MAKDLLFITNHRLGDAVLTTGVLQEALNRFAPDRVTIVCGPIPAALFEAVPQLERISIVDKTKPVRYWLNFWAQSVGRKWDVVIDIRNTLVSHLVPARAVYRYGRSDATKHKTEQLAKVLGLSSLAPGKIWLTKSAEAKAEKLLPAGAPVLALCPWAGSVPKQWPPDRFVAAAREIRSLVPELSRARIAIFGAPHESPRARDLVAALEGQCPVVDLVGKTTPLEAAACLARCSLVLANDSGLMHLASAMGAPTLGLFGPSNDVEYRPLGPRATFVRRAAFDKSADPHALMLAISVEDVVAAAQRLCANTAP